MATELAREGFVGRTTTFYREVVAEMKKVTWPDRAQVRQLSIGVVILSLIVGGVIAIMDISFRAVFMQWLPALFAGG
jgi:preprotein translocase subunit SecE